MFDKAVTQGLDFVADSVSRKFQQPVKEPEMYRVYDEVRMRGALE
jgi:hypothetical protein